ncbi:MAG: lamin tail domain-containing protein, partial [Candidatus Izemoplasmatales bacterium]
GALVGQASGVIARVSSRGDMHANTHTFQPSYSIRPYYYIGGIVGSAALGAELNMRDVINYGDIYGFGTMSTFSFASGVSKIDIKIGGVIGYILNTASVSHHLVYATNMGDLILDDVIHSPSMPSSQNVGGVFGEAAGPAPILYDVVIIEEEEHEVLRFAYLYNEGNVIHEAMTGTSIVKAAGIGISNTTTATEYALLFNHGSFNYDSLVYYPQGTELFFSEYIEGSSSNKALELYNPTDGSISLVGYSIEMYANGATSPTSTYSFSSGSISAGGTYVIVNSSGSNTLRNLRDLQITSGIMAFDGNDALVLKKNGIIIDSIGQVGNNPGTGGWIGGGLSTTNRTLVRKSRIYSGRTNAYSSFDPSDEWLGYSQDVFTNLRSHTVISNEVQPFSSRLFDYTTTIFDISASTPITLTRAYNYADLRYDSSYYHRVSPFYDSVNHNPTVIRYSANYGNIDYFNLDNDGTTMIPIELQTDTQISGITTVTNVDFLNVINHGDIKVVNVNLLTNTLSVSGFSYILSSGKYLKNSVNLGKITVASINSATTGNPNIYVGGLVNVNNSGDLHLETQNPNQPIATLGIINSLNYGEITSTYSATYHGILGRSNTYAAGIATLNAGSIQDSANLGAVRIYNSSSSGTTSLAGDGATANRITAFTHGVTAGGVTGITLSGNARVYDTANNGDVVAIAYRYARAGGIIATSLYSEAVAGGISISVFGLSDSIEQSVLLNGMNFGNISAVTFVIGSYSTSSYTSYNTNFRYGEGDAAGGTTGVSINPNTIVASNDRPGVYAAAGGVVGYGLSVMRNMLNHGTISGTDVAGGIVGATYVEGAQSPNTKTTVVDINTAINYGDIKAIATTSFGSISKTLLSYENISGFFKPDSQVYPTLHAADFPRDKRGFGGIFGRLQRGVRGIMSTEGGSFDFIVNANPNIDLVGRLDMDYSFTSSARYFQFYDAIYYSARLNDNTQAVFTGFYYGELLITGKSSNRAPYTYTATIVNVYTQIGTIPTLH